MSMRVTRGHRAPGISAVRDYDDSMPCFRLLRTRPEVRRGPGV